MPLGPQANFATKWNEALKDEKIPRYLRSVVRISYGEFSREVLRGTAEFAAKFVDSIAAGDLWVVEETLTAAEIAEVKRGTLAFRESHAESNPKRVEGVPNYHQMQDGSTAPAKGYVAVDHSSYFFRWNGDAYGLFAIAEEAWQLGKIVSGKAPDEFVANTPNDLSVDRIQVIQYPAGVGKISSHDDPFVSMKVNVGVFLSSSGADYRQGGFFIARGPREPMLVDPQIKAGDMVLWFPNLVHGVETIDPDETADWASPGGRWYMQLNTIDSDVVQKRQVARPAS